MWWGRGGSFDGERREYVMEEGEREWGMLGNVGERGDSEFHEGRGDGLYKKGVKGCRGEGGRRV